MAAEFGPEVVVKKAPKARCEWCGKGTTNAQKAKGGGKCGGCAKMFERFDYRETARRIPETVEDVVGEMILEQPTLDRAASQMKKKYPLKHPMREWDAALVILIDERRRNRYAREHPDRDSRSGRRVHAS